MEVEAPKTRKDRIQTMTKLRLADIVVVNDPTNTTAHTSGFILEVKPELVRVQVVSSTLAKYQDTSDYFFPTAWVAPMPEEMKKALFGERA